MTDDTDASDATDVIVADDIDVRPLDALSEYDQNPKSHPSQQIEKIAASIREYGWDVPIVVDADGEIIKGHGRLRAAERLGLDRVPVIERDDLADDEARAARIADNRTSESTWEMDTLGLEIDALDQHANDLDLDALGFDDDELDYFTSADDASTPGVETPDTDVGEPTAPDADGDESASTAGTTATDEPTSPDADDERDAAADGPVNDPYEEWDQHGPIAYENDDVSPDYTIKVHFNTRADLDAFADLVDQTITENTQSIYYPEHEDAEIIGKEFVDASTQDAESAADDGA